MSQQVLCFDTLTSVCQCRNFPDLQVPVLPTKQSYPSTTNAVDPRNETDVEIPSTLTEDQKTKMAIIIVCVLAVLAVVVVIAGLVYFKYIKKRGSSRTQPTTEPDKT